MGKLDKKTLKILKTRQYSDLDAGEIAVALQCDDESAQESLHSLKDQGLIENFSRNGKTYWRINSAEPHGNRLETKVVLDKGNGMSSETEAFLIELKPKEKIRQASPLSFEPEKINQEKRAVDNDEFFIDLKPNSPKPSLQMPADAASKLHPKDTRTLEAEEFLIASKPKEPTPAVREPVAGDSIKKPGEKSGSETEEFYINLLSRKVESKPEKPAEVKPQTSLPEKKLSETQEFYIDLLSDEPKAESDQVVDDETRSWNMPSEFIFKAKVANDGKFKKESPEVQPADDIPPKRSPSSIGWVIASIVLSVLLSTGITVLITSNITQTADANLQALSATIAETSAKRDQRIEMLAKKVLMLMEETDRLQKSPRTKGKRHPRD